MRKLLSVILVLAMVLGLVGTAFAATATDVTGTSYETAVGRLNVLGILKGYTDGSFKPNNNITRAEFAAVAVRALGLEEVAKSTAGVTQFKDVAPTHWAAGYIAVAVGRGVIKGYPDGTFKPEANVTNAEAMAMLIRVLGYEPAVTGEWPMNYVSKAGEIGLTDGTNLSPNSAAIRGDVALLTDNSLTIGLMEQNYFGTLTSYYVTSKTLLSNKLNVTEIDSARVIDAAAYDRTNLDANEVQLSWTDANGDPASDVFTFAGVDMNALLGHKVNVWVKDGGVFYAVDKTAASKVVTVTVDTAFDEKINYTNAAGNAAVIKLASADPTFFYNHAKETTYDDSMLVMAGFDPLDDSTWVWPDGRQPVATCILNDKGQADFVIASMPDVYSYVTKVDTTTPEIAAVIADGTDATLPDVSDDEEIYTIVDVNGKTMNYSDLKVGDVLNVFQGSDGGFWIVDVRNTVSGEVTKVTTTNESNLTKFKVYVGTTAYSLSLFPTQLDDETYAEITTGNAYDLVGTTGKFALDAAGKIAIADVTAPATTSIWAFAKGTQFPVGSTSGVVYYLKVKTLDGVTSTLPVNADEDASAVTAGDLLTYDLNAKGEIVDLDVNPTPTRESGLVDAAIDDTNNRITIDPDAGTTLTFVVTADTKIFDITGTPTAVTWAAVEGATGVGAQVYANADFAGRADLILITASDDPLTTTTTTYVALKSKYTDGDGKHLVVDENGTEKDYVVATGATNVDTFLYKEIAELDFNASGEVTNVAEVAFDVAATKITSGNLDVTGGIVILGGNSYYTTKDTVVIDVDGTPVASTFSALKVGYTVKLYTDGANNINVLAITDK